MSRFAYPACKAFQDVSSHGSELARQEVKNIIAAELAEARTIALVCVSPNPEDPPNRRKVQVLVGGTVRGWRELPASKVCVVTRSGIGTGEDQPPTIDRSMQTARLNPYAQPFIPAELVDEAGNLLPTPNSQPSQRGVGGPAGGLDPEEQSSSSNAPYNQSSRRGIGGSPHELDPEESNSSSDLPTGIPLPSLALDYSQPPNQHLLFDDWAGDYMASEWWGGMWCATQDPGSQWPEDVKLAGNRLLFKGRTAVQEAQVINVFKTLHHFLNHIGANKLVKEIDRRYVMPNSVRLYQEAARICRECNVCQSCNYPNFRMKAPIHLTPIPDQIMSSMALDILSLPSVRWEGENFDSLLVCVDRLSGWMIARPCRKVGLTAERAAHLVLDNGWETFGIPSIITSDQGPQFVGQWWRTMCARLGIRVAYSQAYWPQANGRAEVACKTLKCLLQKIWNESHINWVEALPRVLRAYHDTVGEAGLSPFQIVFGRERNLAGVPYTPVRECEDATLFFDRMERVDKQVADTLREIHRSREEKENSNRRERTPFRVGDWVWMLRPKCSRESKLDTWWVGPYKVIRQVGVSSFELLITPGNHHAVHIDQIKPYLGDILQGEPTEIIHFEPEYHVQGTGTDEWNVESILRHKVREDGQLVFLTRWENAEAGSETWEPVSQFITRYCWKFAEYCQNRGINIDLAQYLSPKPLGEEV